MYRLSKDVVSCIIKDLYSDCNYELDNTIERNLTEIVYEDLHKQVYQTFEFVEFNKTRNLNSRVLYDLFESKEKRND